MSTCNICILCVCLSGYIVRLPMSTYVSKSTITVSNVIFYYVVTYASIYLLVITNYNDNYINICVYIHAINLYVI